MMGSAWNEDLNVERLGYARGGETKNVGTATHDSHRFLDARSTGWMFWLFYVLMIPLQLMGNTL